MTVTNQLELTQYCLRKLGAPLVEINITDEQMDDCINEGISYFRDYYWDGIEKMYLKHQIVQADIDNGYITLPDNIFGVNRIFPGPGSAGVNTNIFDLQYQMRMNDMRDLTSVSMVYYTQMMQHIDLLDQLLNTQKQFRFNKLTNKIYIDENWNYKEAVGAWLVFDCYSSFDVATTPKFWDDRWFKHYITALFKKQHGQNIKKFGGITLPGGVQIDGQAIYDEGVQEIKEVEDFIQNQAPLEWVMG